jgi:hypothetical protein
VPGDRRLVGQVLDLLHSVGPRALPYQTPVTF